MSIKERLCIKNLNLCGRLCHIQTTTSEIGDWQNRPHYLFISLKNQDFTKDLIRWFVDLCESLATAGRICVVDEPYLFNLKAERGLDPLPSSDVSKLKRISWEVKRRAQKAIRGACSEHVSMVSWQHLSAVTPAWMKKEIAEAFEMKGHFYH